MKRFVVRRPQTVSDRTQIITDYFSPNKDSPLSYFSPSTVFDSAAAAVGHLEFQRFEFDQQSITHTAAAAAAAASRLLLLLRKCIVV